MNTYTAYFCTGTDCAVHEIKAATPEQALMKARRMYAGRALDVIKPVNEIAICDRDSQQLTAWVDDDLRLWLAANDLLAAAELVVARWERGDLAEAIRELSAAIGKAKGGAA
jgi:hypothetical protein